jgi:hypothetical protein
VAVRDIGCEHLLLGLIAEQARLLSAAIQRELAPVLERLRRLEERLA